MMRLHQVVIDARNPGSLVRFWAALLGGEPVDREMGWAHVEPPDFVRLSFQPVPEDKVVKNVRHGHRSAGSLYSRRTIRAGR